MSGFQAPRTTYKLVFDEPEYAGLEIKVRGTTLDELFELDEVIEAISTAADLKGVRDGVRARNALFVDKVTSWNVEDDGVPVECTVDALGAFEAPFVNRIVNQWRRAANGVVPAPLDGGSTSGDEVESALMAIPSESLAS